jgi:transcriptional regulator of acetoin/glycerol metabolism
LQQLLARSLKHKRAPWERADALDLQLALTSVSAPEELASQGLLEPSLAFRLGDALAAPVVLPRLRDRAEDLRAIITDRLACEGMRVLGRPVGIEQAAYGRLAEYAFPGEDAELATIVRRLVAHCRGELVRIKDVDALRLPIDRGTSRRKDPLSA